MFSRGRKRRTKITNPTASSLDYQSETVTQRLGTIAEHYARLESVLAEVESKLPAEPPPPQTACQVTEPSRPKMPR
jgi:hypothetical protein